MRGFSLRLAALAVVVASFALAGIGPSTAAAAECEGQNIKGQGASTQNLAMNSVWRPAYNKKCEGKGLAGFEEQLTEYNPSGSGKCLESFEKNYGPGNAFCGTDEPPNKLQKEKMETNAGNGAVVLTIPVVQLAVSIPVHLPAGCTSATNTGAKKLPGRLLLTQKTLEGIFAHTITKWSELKDGGSKLLPEGCEGTTEITRVVREDGSGTTSIVKKWMFQLDKSSLETEAGKKGTWKELAEANPNTEWPANKESIVRAAKGSGVVKAVAEKAGSIGYANLADARANEAFLPKGGGGAGSAIFWAPLENKPPHETIPAKYADPSTNAESNTVANSNCLKTKYVDIGAEGKKAKFPPESTKLPWNEVTAQLVESKYSLCGFSYVLALTKYSGATSTEGTTALEVQTLQSFTSYLLGQGQIDIEKSDYLGIPTTGTAKTNVTLIAQAGQKEIKF